MRIVIHTSNEIEPWIYVRYVAARLEQGETSGHVQRGIHWAIEDDPIDDDLREQIKSALEGDSGDAEFSALWAVATALGIEIDAE